MSPRRRPPTSGGPLIACTSPAQASLAHHADIGRGAARGQGGRDPAHLPWFRAGRRSHGLAVARPRTWPQEHHRHRHGRHLLRGGPHHQQRAAGGRREDHRPVPLQAPATRDDVHRLRRRQHRPGGSVQPLDQSGPGERRGRPRSGVLPAWRHRTHSHRRRCRARAPFGRQVPGRPHAPRPRRRPAGDRRSGRADRAGARGGGRRHPADQQRASGRAHPPADGGAGLRPARFRGLRLRRGRSAARFRLRSGAWGQGRRHPAWATGPPRSRPTVAPPPISFSTSRKSACSSRPSRRTS